MHVETNMMMRGSTWSVRIAVPKALRELRALAGMPDTSKEVWRSLGTGDDRAARLKAVEAKAAILREFENEIGRLTEQLKQPLRSIPTDFQLQQAVFEFKAREQGELYRERLHYLPTGSQVRAAEEQLQRLDQSPRSVSESPLDRFLKRLDHVVVTERKQDVFKRRRILRNELVAHLEDNEFTLVDWAIKDIADRHGYLIEPEGVHYRILGALLIRAWIQELDAAEGVASNLAVTDAAANLLTLTPRETPVVSDTAVTAVVANSGEGQQHVERDIVKLYATYLAEQKGNQSSSDAALRQRVMQQFVEVAGIRDVGQFRKSHLIAYKRLLRLLPPNAARDYLWHWHCSGCT